MLKRVRHPSGHDILFDAKWHRYTLGSTTLRPVSKLLDRYFPFDEKRILGLVAKKSGETTAAVKKSWSRQALLGKNVHAYIESRLLDLPPPTFVLLLHRRAAALDARDASATGPRPRGGGGGSDKGDATQAMTSSQSEAEMLHGEEAAYMAVADHAVDTIKAAYDVFAVEQVIASPSWGLAGTADFLARHRRTGRVLIGDWKTSGSVGSNFRFGSYETPCPGCLRHVPNTKAHRYAMQVIVYGEIMKHERYFESGFFDAALRRALAGGGVAATNDDDGSCTSAADDDDSSSSSSAATATTGKQTKQRGRGKSVAAAAAATTTTTTTTAAVHMCSHDEAARTREVQRALDDYHAGIDGTFDYGVVQLEKNDAGEVAVSFRGVAEHSMLPPDACEMTFRRLLRSVVEGD